MLDIERHFTTTDIDPYDKIDWELRTARVGRADEAPVFEQTDIEVPVSWSQNATNIVAQKYFAYAADDPRRETSVRQMIDRVVNKMTTEGIKNGYFDDTVAKVFSDELRHILVNQLAAFNSPVWFNLGVAGAFQQSSACFILSVDDSLESITRWYTEEAKIFQGGSGAGVNLSALRGSGEQLSRGGVSSGPVTFMRAADASAGTLQSGGRTRRAAKLVCLDVDHPDIEDFIHCKAREEDRIHALAAAGFDMSINTPAGEKNRGEATAYQNANNSVRVSDEFMKAVANDEEWELTARTDGHVMKRLPARELLKEIAEAAWHCADPGLQFSSTIQDWHTTPEFGPITASNPCSEYVHVDNSACNLASLNLLKFLNADGSFDIEGFVHTVRIIFIAQEITIAFADFPTRKIAKNTKALRQIGIGYANLGALLMACGLPYDSDDGRAYAAAITALMTGEAYRTSAMLAEKIGPFEHYPESEASMLRILDKHRTHARKLKAPDETSRQIVKAAKAAWDATVAAGTEHGVRNAQASVTAPTGTISFMLDCDTTGIEPDFALVKQKALVGGGSMTLINRTIPLALKNLGYQPEQINEIIAYIEEEVDRGNGYKGPRGSVIGAPHLREQHYHVFDCAVGENAIEPMGHVKMVGAVQPFLSGSVSKTVNLPKEATVEDITEVYTQAWELGLKALAVYRDGSKAGQPLGEKEDRDEKAVKAAEARLTSLLGDGLLRGERRSIPREAKVVGVNFNIGTVGGYVHVRLFEDGTPGAIFVDVGQAGSTLHGFIHAWAVTMSLGFQYGLPLDMLVSKLAWAQFEPSGMTDDPQIRTARSIVDYVVRWLATEFLELDPITRQRLGLLEPAAGSGGDEHDSRSPIPGGEILAAPEVSAATRPKAEAPTAMPNTPAAGLCSSCGGMLVRTGTCTSCTVCGDTSGCG